MKRLGFAKINESVTTQGYYYIKGKFETHEVTQTLDKEPDINQMRKCANLLDSNPLDGRTMTYFQQ